MCPLTLLTFLIGWFVYYLNLRARKYTAKLDSSAPIVTSLAFENIWLVGFNAFWDPQDVKVQLTLQYLSDPVGSEMWTMCLFYTILALIPMRCYWSFISLSEGAIKTIIPYWLVEPNSSHPQKEHLPWTHLKCGGHSCVQFSGKWVLNIQIVITTAIDMINNNRSTVMMQWSSEALFEYVWLAKPLQENLNL